MSLNIRLPPSSQGQCSDPPGGWGQVSWVAKKALSHFPKLLFAPMPPSPHTHSLFSVKNHKVLLDRIKAVLKVVILLLVRTSAGCHQVLSHPLRWEHFHLVCLSSHGCPSGFLPKPELYPQAAEHLGVCTSQMTLSQ